MDRYFFASVLLFLISINIAAQNVKTPLDDYIENAKTIVIARCTYSGPINKIAQARVQLEIIMVVKGDSEIKELSTSITGGLAEGDIYLIRLPDHEKKPEKALFGTNGANVIPVSRSENFDLLKTLSPRIVVLRTINLQIERLKNNIQRNTASKHFLEELKKGS